jgi:phosphatidylethanolamine/phosphatidyl-N-methylethanolamine N-methyltransferase
VTSHSSAHDLQFFRSFLARPWKIASPIPSGRKLATRIAEQIDRDPGGYVLELGPGTGAVTRAICERVREQDLIAIENDPGFLSVLRAQFPRAQIIEGDAFAFADVLGKEAWGFRSIVSGLPIIGRSRELRRRFLESAIGALQPGKPFVQFSYSGRAPFPCIDGVTAERAAIVWQNIVPMHIWVYRCSGTKLRLIRDRI